MTNYKVFIFLDFWQKSSSDHLIYYPDIKTESKGRNQTLFKKTELY